MNVVRAKRAIKFVSNGEKKKHPGDGGESKPPMKSLSQGINFILEGEKKKRWKKSKSISPVFCIFQTSATLAQVTFPEKLHEDHQADRSFYLTDEDGSEFVV